MRKIILCKFDFRVEIVSGKWMPVVEPGGVAAGQRGGGTSRGTPPRTTTPSGRKKNYPETLGKLTLAYFPSAFPACWRLFRNAASFGNSGSSEISFSLFFGLVTFFSSDARRTDAATRSCNKRDPNFRSNNESFATFNF